MARKSMSSFDIYSWVNTSGKLILGQRVDNAYYEGKFVLLKIKTKISDFLLIEPSIRIHFTKRVRPSSEFVSKPFAMLLRKYIRNQKINLVEQIGFDRIVKIIFSNEKLFAEILPKGVVVLTDEENQILGSTKYLKFKDREIKSKVKYIFPKIIETKPWELKLEEIVSNISKYKDIARGLVMGLNIPGEVAEEVLYLLGIPKETNPSNIDRNSIEQILINLKKLIDMSLEGKGYIYFINENPMQATPFISKNILENGGRMIEYESFDIALDDYFNMISEVVNTKIEEEKSKIMHSIEENKILSAKYIEESQKLERDAQLIAQNYSAIEEIVNCINKNNGNCKNVVKIDNKEKYAIIDFNGELIKVYFNESLDKTIIRLYKEAGELRSKSKKAMSSIDDMMKRLNELEEKIEVEKVKNLIKNRRKEWYEKYHWVITRNDFLAIGGKDADQNESIVKKYLKDKDVYIHADIHGSPSVVLFAENNEVKEDDINDAAIIAVAYSKAWKAGMGSVGVYWVYGNQVSKSPPSGEYLSKGSFMIYGKKNFLKPFNVELYIGVTFREEIPIIISGSEENVKLKSIVYSKIIPGEKGQKEIAEELKIEFSKLFNDKERIYMLALDENEIMQKIPGKSRIIFVKKGLNKSTINLKYDLLDSS
ncbi:ribosome rescue protein RqcH [Caldisphaera sp.]|uniref:ribosome rescue protein RqcH n=1 Tax=Caldisphaera sp. TaxID=2060322 RepID=UPI003D12314E